MSHSGGRENRLARESSPYLLLHAKNPVDWYPWGEEAFAEARRADKPIFLSVGYSTCYWCHVMEREVFSNEEIASRMNEGFVNIKLDREERPDLDEIYMTATQLLTRAGGWPNSLFLTHELKPFYAGTYFPPHDGHGRPGFPRVLAAIREAWSERRDSVREQAEAVTEGMREQMSVATPGAVLPSSSDAVGAALSALARRFDPEWGGFGPAPKFPSPSNLFFLLDLAQRGEKDEEARGMLVATLDHMARGGIHDQIGGGFHRYSTDGEWLVPHFEKMLYDNAALALLFAEAAVSFGRVDFGVVARSTFEFVLAELTGPDGGFLSAIDAETDGHEGAYYTWTREDLEGILDPAAFELLALVYGFSGSPNFERDRYVLHLPEPLAERARTMGLTVEDLRARMEPGRRALLDARWKRKRPLVDDKVLADWNGLMIAALARGGALLGEPRYVEAAGRAARVVLERLEHPEGLRHGYRGDVARVPAVLDDYSFLISGLLELHAAAPEPRWLEHASRLQAEQDRRLWDAGGGGYYSAGEDPHLLFQAKTPYDGAVASGNGVAALNLLRLGALRGESYDRRARELLAAFGHGLAEWPLAHVTLVRALARASEGAASSSSVDGTAAPAKGPSALEATAHAVVELRARVLEAPGPWKPFTVDLIIRSGWHVNANPASEPFLIPSEVGAVRGSLRNVRYPAGEPLRTELSPRDISVYGSLARIEGEIEIAGEAPGEIEVTYQACDETRCLPPVTRLVSLTAGAAVSAPRES